MKYYINGKYVKEKDAKISIHDMGFSYGYGIFETIRFDEKKIFAYAKHINRLYNGLKFQKLKLKEQESNFINFKQSYQH